MSLLLGKQNNCLRNFARKINRIFVSAISQGLYSLMLHEHESLEETQKPSAQRMPGPLKIPWAGGQTQTERLTRASHAGIHFSSLLQALAGYQSPTSLRRSFSVPHNVAANSKQTL